MAKTFFFYDLETSGLDARSDRIMQFAGIRTDENFEALGEPYNLLVKLAEDTLPSPEAIMVTGITPQATQADGYTEAEFAKILLEEIFTPDTTVVGFNNIRFDDEFIRHLLWRNFHDPYQWAWSDGRSRWDLLDVVRMTRALRPDGINWPVDATGKPVNKLELLAAQNGLEHTKAHDALSDVEALIGVTKLIRNTQPELFAYLLKLRDKKAVRQLANLDQPSPFVYVSGRYDAEFNKATVAYPLAPGSNGNLLVYDLRHDPTPFLAMTTEQLKQNMFASWQQRQADDFTKIPIKELQYNRAPAIAPLGVLSQQNGWQKLKLDTESVQSHIKTLRKNPEFARRVEAALKERPAFKSASLAEAQLYDGFIGDRDKLRAETVSAATSDDIATIKPEFADQRLTELFAPYVVRNYPAQASNQEREAYEEYREKRLNKMAPAFINSLQTLAANETDDSKQYLLEELKLWFEAIMPEA